MTWRSVMLNLKVTVPEGTSGDWRVERFTVTEVQSRLDAIRGMFNDGRYVPPGTYTRLLRNNHVVMSDTPDEVRDHSEPIYRAHGRCLINGLGLGVVLTGIAHKVAHVTVVESSFDVIKLVGPHYTAMLGSKLTIVHDDALEYTPLPNTRYQMVWHDIWDNICANNLPQMTRLHRKYGRRTLWQGSWARELCRLHCRP